MNRAPVLPSGYTLAKFQKDRIKNNGDIEAESKRERKKENNKDKNFTKISYWITLELGRHTNTVKNNLTVKF